MISDRDLAMGIARSVTDNRMIAEMAMSKDRPEEVTEVRRQVAHTLHEAGWTVARISKAMGRSWSSTEYSIRTAQDRIRRANR